MEMKPGRYPPCPSRERHGRGRTMHGGASAGDRVTTGTMQIQPCGANTNRETRPEWVYFQARDVFLLLLFFFPPPSLPLSLPPLNPSLCRIFICLGFKEMCFSKSAKEGGQCSERTFSHNPQSRIFHRLVLRLTTKARRMH